MNTEQLQELDHSQKCLWKWPGSTAKWQYC